MTSISGRDFNSKGFKVDHKKWLEHIKGTKIRLKVVIDILKRKMAKIW